MKAGVRKSLPWVIGGLVLAVVVLALRPSPVVVDLATAQRGPLRVTLSEEGETRVRDRFVFSAPLAGRVLRIELEPGDEVRAAETVLATFLAGEPSLLDSRSRSEAEAAVRAAAAGLGRAQAELERTRAERDFAYSELGRYRRLAEEEIVSEERLESVRLDAATSDKALRSAEFSVNSAEHELEMARARLLQAAAEGGSQGALITLRSPVNGVVLRRLRESEAVVAAGEPLLEVGDPSDLEIVSDLLSSDVVKVRPGHRVLIEHWGGEQTLAGRVRRVEPSGFTKVSALGVEEQRVNVIVDFDHPREAWAALGDAYRVEIRIVVWETPDTLKVPNGSLFRHADGWALYTLEDGKARLTPVQVGRRNDLEAEVVEGLAGGELLIVHPGDAVEDGVAVIERGLG